MSATTEYSEKLILYTSKSKYHKDQANDKDYSHEGVGFSFKKWQADNVMKRMDSDEVKYFEKDKGAAKEPVSILMDATHD